MTLAWVIFLLAAWISNQCVNGQSDQISTWKNANVIRTPLEKSDASFGRNLGSEDVFMNSPSINFSLPATNTRATPGCGGSQKVSKVHFSISITGTFLFNLTTQLCNRATLNFPGNQCFDDATRTTQTSIDIVSGEAIVIEVGGFNDMCGTDALFTLHVSLLHFPTRPPTGYSADDIAQNIGLGVGIPLAGVLLSFLTWLCKKAGTSRDPHEQQPAVLPLQPSPGDLQDFQPLYSDGGAPLVNTNDPALRALTMAQGKLQISTFDDKS
jgi:hypothetical protein